MKVFKNIFGSWPTLQVMAPGRVNLIGEHIDYLQGCVMPMAIEPSVIVHAALSPTPNQMEVVSDQVPEKDGPRTLNFADLCRRETADERWLNYIIGVLAVYRREGIQPKGFRIHLASTIPAGAGLSSSAALETAVALTVEHFAGVHLDPLRRAQLCQQAEHEFAKVPCGIMDQLAVGACKAGHTMLLDCRDGSTQHLPLPEDIAVVVADTGVSHALADGEYAKRRKQCEEAMGQLGIESFRELSQTDLPSMYKNLNSELLRRRARHVVTEMARVQHMNKALCTGDLSEVGRIMAAGHASLRDDFEVSCPEADHLVHAAKAFGPEQGLIGARMTGGGFGGSTVHLVRRDSADALRTHLNEAFQQALGRKIASFVTRPSAGATAEAL